MTVNGASATIAGNLTADPELRYTQDGKPVADFTVAYTERIFDRSKNEWADYGETLFMRCSAWLQMGQNVAQSLRKGNAVVVTGILRQRSYDATDGTKRTVVELRADIVSVDLRRQTVPSVIRERKNAMPDDGADSWAPSPVDEVKTRRTAAAAAA